MRGRSRDPGSLSAQTGRSPVPFPYIKQARREPDEPAAYGGSWLLGATRDLRRDQLGAYERALLRHGGRPVRFRVGPPRIGFEFDVVFDPEGARQVLATDAASYDKKVPIFDEFRWVIGQGLITSEDERWRRDRRTVAPVMTRRSVQSHLPTIAGAADRLVQSWAPTAAANGAVDLHLASMHYALDVLGASVFGEDVEVLAPVFAETVPLLSEHVTRRALSPVRLPRSWPTPANRRAEQAKQRLWGVVGELIARRRAAGRPAARSVHPRPGANQSTTASSAAPHSGDLLDLLLAARDPETGEALDDGAVRDQALTFLVAGHETTATTLALSLHLLGRNQHEQQRVRDEARAVGDELDQLPVTVAVVNETLRLYPSGHTIVRRARHDTTIGGYPVSEGRIVAVSIWGIHHNPAVWKDPSRFNPDRFAHPADGGGDSTRYTHLPFGGGPRGCIGQHLAMAELIVAVAAVARAYRLESLLEKPNLDAGASVRPAGALPCRISPVRT